VAFDQSSSSISYQVSINEYSGSHFEVALVVVPVLLRVSNRKISSGQLSVRCTEYCVFFMDDRSTSPLEEQVFGVIPLVPLFTVSF
jgi:hypothetical protein